jgi:DNA-binding transcriptional MerR regulator
MKYTVKAAAIATGVTESRLRTWERRYGIPKPGRSPTGRRLYGEEDLATIRRMAALVGAGIPPSEAAQAALVGTEPSRPDQPAAPEPVEDGLAATIRRASHDYDEAATVSAVQEAVAAKGWADALDTVIMPALRRIGDSWADDGIVSANEHFTTEIIRREIASAIGRHGPQARDAQVVLLACPEDERHEFGLLAFALLLRDRGLRTVYLGADVPLPDLLTALKRTRPAAVCLAATTQSGLTSLARASRAVLSARGGARLFVGGPAFRHRPATQAFAGVLLPQSLGAAAKLVAEALDGQGR